MTIERRNGPEEHRWDIEMMRADGRLMTLTLRAATRSAAIRLAEQAYPSATFTASRDLDTFPRDSSKQG